MGDVVFEESWDVKPMEDEDVLATPSRRHAAARERAARERAERLRQALERLPELEAKKKAGEKDKARASGTDPEATVIVTTMASEMP